MSGFFEWLYGEDCLRNPNGHAYTALFRPLPPTTSIFLPMVPEDRSFPQSSPVLDELRARRSQLWNGPTLSYRGQIGEQLLVSPGSYFDMLNSAILLEREAKAAIDAGGDFEQMYRAMPLRFERQQGAKGPDTLPLAWSGALCSASLGCSTLFVVNVRGQWRFVARRRSMTVSDDPGLFHVLPSFVFEPDGTGPTAKPPDLCSEILRELQEELFSQASEIAGQAPAGIHRLRELMHNGGAHLQVTGIALDLWTLRPDVLTLLVVRDPTWYETFKADLVPCTEEWAALTEGELLLFDPTDPSLFAPTGIFAPGRCVVAGAASLIAGMRALRMLEER